MSSPDPTQPDPNADSVHEPAEVTIQRWQANADIAMTPCSECGTLPRPIVWHADGRTTFEVIHETGCSHTIPEDDTTTVVQPRDTKPPKTTTRKDNPAEEEDGR